MCPCSHCLRFFVLSAVSENYKYYPEKLNYRKRSERIEFKGDNEKERIDTFDAYMAWST